MHSAENISLNPENRAFCYGDGLFETIVTGTQRINLLDFHMSRLKLGCSKLGMSFPDFNSAKLRAMIDQLSAENSLSKEVRCRLQVWRNPGGKYTPRTNEVSYLISAEEHNGPFYGSIAQIGISQTSRVVKSEISFAKTMSAMPYILAGIEKENTKFEDLIILSAEGHLAESISANLFWIKDGIFFTPSLETGCIDGVMRKYLLQELESAHIEYQEVLHTPDQLRTADSLFLTNVTGVVWVKSYRERNYESPVELINAVLKQPLPL